MKITFFIEFRNLIYLSLFWNRKPKVAPKEHSDNGNSINSEFNPAYSFELTTNPTQCEVDTFDHILQVTSHHEAVYAYYYMDDNNKVSAIDFAIQTFY